MKLREGIIPPGGFHFIDRSGAVEQRIESHDLPSLAAAVLKHRLNNRREPGNPLKEIVDYICTSWGHFCYDEHPGPQAPVGDDSGHISRRASAWMGSFYTRFAADPGVSQQEADRRAAVCAVCPMNVEYRTGCAACSAQVDQLSFIWLGGRKANGEKNLKACDLTSMALRPAVWASDLPALPEETRTRLPEACWRR